MSYVGRVSLCCGCIVIFGFFFGYTLPQDVPSRYNIFFVMKDWYNLRNTSLFSSMLCSLWMYLCYVTLLSCYCVITAHYGSFGGSVRSCLCSPSEASRPPLPHYQFQSEGLMWHPPPPRVLPFTTNVLSVMTKCRPPPQFSGVHRAEGSPRDRKRHSWWEEGGVMMLQQRVWEGVDKMYSVHLFKEKKTNLIIKT